MRMRAAKDPAVQRSRQHHVVGVDGAAGDLGYGIDSWEWLTYYGIVTSPLGGEVGANFRGPREVEDFVG
jgi:hypothetical protein